MREEYIGGNVIGSRPLLADLPFRLPGVLPGRLADAVRTGKIDLEDCRLGQVEIQVTAHVKSVVSVAGIIASSIIIDFEEVPFVHIFGGSKIFHKVCTATDAHVCTVRHGVVLEQGLLPVDVRVAFALL